ncbi:MAG: NAD(P)/FAD-dependent oxidoreductase, partial [Clostridiales Family XIII bacterium]|nr:NAD(P)/FAD-dependent oxidoreductase [Clostridiales Family XIII bacterium]
MYGRENEKYGKLFEPIQVGKLTLKSRIAFSPMVSCLSTATGEVTSDFVHYMGMQGRSGAGLITIGETTVDEEMGNAFGGELSVNKDAYIAGLNLLTDEAHRYGAKISIELCHPGRGANPEMNVEPFVFAPTAIPTNGSTRYIREMDQHDIDAVIEKFVTASKRLVKAEFDMLMLHCAHGNLLGAFLSPFTNKRTDWYGGSLENRARFPLEIMKAIRQEVGDEIAIEMRISGDERIDGGMRIEETKDFINMAQEYIDMVHVSQGLIMPLEAAFNTMPPYYHPHCHNIKYSEAVKNDPRIKIPVAVVGSIMQIDESLEIIETGKADIVAMARAFLADPELLNNAWTGETYKTRPCLRCFQYCSGKCSLGKALRCVVNPVLGRESRYAEIPLAKKKKKVVVAGGGPAGLEATRILLERGHDVTLIEQCDRLGGRIHDISGHPFKQDMRNYLKWTVESVTASDAKILLNTDATKENILAENPDALFLAFGSDPITLKFPGYDRPNVHSVIDVDGGKVQIGQNDRVVVVGGGLSGMECALALAMEGRSDVTVLDLIPEEKFAADMVLITRMMLLDQLKQYKVKLVGDKIVRGITDEGVEVEGVDWRYSVIPADSVI